jgi:hypothetical protein
MFRHSIDLKEKVTDPNGNEIVDLTKSPFLNPDEPVVNYIVRKVSPHYVMLPDLVSYVEYGTQDNTEFIMKFNQNPNPFAFDKEDILLIPSQMEAESIMTAPIGNDAPLHDASVRDVLVRNYYRVSTKHNLVDMSSYKQYQDTPIPSGNVTPDNTDNRNGNRIPYVLDNGEQAIQYRNGRMYFITNSNTEPDGTTGTSSPGSGSGTGGAGVADGDTLTTANIDAKIQSILKGVENNVSDSNCMYNGTNLADFIKSLNND